MKNSENYPPEWFSYHRPCLEKLSKTWFLLLLLRFVRSLLLSLIMNSPCISRCPSGQTTSYKPLADLRVCCRGEFFWEGGVVDLSLFCLGKAGRKGERKSLGDWEIGARLVSRPTFIAHGSTAQTSRICLYLTVYDAAKNARFNAISVRTEWTRGQFDAFLHCPPLWGVQWIIFGEVGLVKDFWLGAAFVPESQQSKEVKTWFSFCVRWTNLSFIFSTYLELIQV